MPSTRSLFILHILYCAWARPAVIDDPVLAGRRLAKQTAEVTSKVVVSDSGRSRYMRSENGRRGGDADIGNVELMKDGADKPEPMNDGVAKYELMTEGDSSTPGQVELVGDKIELMKGGDSSTPDQIELMGDPNEPIELMKDGVSTTSDAVLGAANEDEDESVPYTGPDKVELMPGPTSIELMPDAEATRVNAVPAPAAPAPPAPAPPVATNDANQIGGPAYNSENYATEQRQAETRINAVNGYVAKVTQATLCPESGEDCNLAPNLGVTSISQAARDLKIGGAGSDEESDPLKLFGGQTAGPAGPPGYKGHPGSKGPMGQPGKKGHPGRLKETVSDLPARGWFLVILAFNVTVAILAYIIGYLVLIEDVLAKGKYMEEHGNEQAPPGWKEGAGGPQESTFVAQPTAEPTEAQNATLISNSEPAY